MQHACGVYITSGDDVGGPRECFDRQEGEGGGRGGQLGVGRGREEPSFVQAVERLAVEGGYADAEQRAA